MTDQEFDILDELYFVISFHDLQSRLKMDSLLLARHLQDLLDKNWVRVYAEPDQELDRVDISMDQFDQFYFLASKEGLFAHNTA